MRYAVEVQGRRFEVEIEGQETVVRVAGGAPTPARLVPRPEPLFSLEHGTRRGVVVVESDPEDPERFYVALSGRAPLLVEARDARVPALARGAGGGARRLSRVKSPMPGVIVDVRVEIGLAVQKGQVLLILEAMKMQNEIRAEGEGKVKAIKVLPGATVSAGALLIEFE